jgi:hypothetical protein
LTSFIPGDTFVAKRRIRVRTTRPKYVLLSAVLPLLLMCAAPSGADIPVGLKIYGAFNTLGGGDFNDGLMGNVNMYAASYIAYSGFSAQGEYGPVHAGFDVGADVILSFSPSFGISFGTGFMRSKRTTEVVFTRPGATVNLSVDPAVTAIPIRVGLVFSRSLGAKLKLLLSGGGEYDLATVRDTLKIGSGPVWEATTNEVRSQGFGLFGGLGVEIMLNPRLSFVVEGRGRYAVLDGFQGSQKFETSGGFVMESSGNLYAFKGTLPGLGAFPLITVADSITVPSPPSVSDFREARISLSGLSLMAGILLHF